MKDIADTGQDGQDAELLPASGFGIPGQGIGVMAVQYIIDAERNIMFCHAITPLLHKRSCRLLLSVCMCNRTGPNLMLESSRTYTMNSNDF